jgi:hypothetical protein
MSTVTSHGYAGGSFENNVVVELVRVGAGGSSGTVLARKAVTYAAPDVGMPGAWSVELLVEPPLQRPAGPLRVVAYFESPRDGARVAEATLDLP